MKHHGKVGTMLILCALGGLACAGCAIQTDDGESELEGSPALAESTGAAQDALWGYAGHAVYVGPRRGYAYRVAFTAGPRLYW